MSTGRIRRAQLVAPFGVGAMSVLVNGTSVITAGLDHWFNADRRSDLHTDEFVVDEWRLQERLRVHELRLPPDRRPPVAGGGHQRNINLSIPALRFPRWSFCIYCKRLHQSPLSMAEPVRCPDAKHEDKKVRPVMAQVPFVVICERGHLDDFPWSSWVHASIQPQCAGTLRLFSRGGGNLSGQVVSCDVCGKDRTLEGVSTCTTRDGREETHLSTRLSSEGEYNCNGARPWVADTGLSCGWPLRAALRGAGNVYFPKVESSIFLPHSQGGASAEVLEVLRLPEMRTRIDLIRGMLGAVTVPQLRSSAPLELLGPFSDEELAAGLEDLLGEPQHSGDSPDDDGEDLAPAVVWRWPEYELLRETPDHPDLVATDPGIPEAWSGNVGRVRRVEVLRETRVLRGFTRVRDGVLRLSDGKALLRRRPLPPGHDWLPAYVVRGEGIYMELEDSALRAWEARDEVRARSERISGNFHVIQQNKGLQPREIAPRFLLLHTLAHVVVNELVYTCGYSSASLRERLYVSTGNHRPMAGMLIYTAAGDSEGTMGGLVRMAEPDNLSAILAAALGKARWCSTDPVCMELGEAGQGPDSCNMAACHGCALLPETSCEEQNRFLDRGLLIGTFDRPNLGFFA